MWFLLRVESLWVCRATECVEERLFLGGQVCRQISFQGEIPLVVSAVRNSRTDNRILVVRVDDAKRIRVVYATFNRNSILIWIPFFFRMFYPSFVESSYVFNAFRNAHFASPRDDLISIEDGQMRVGRLLFKSNIFKGRQDEPFHKVLLP